MVRQDRRDPLSAVTEAMRMVEQTDETAGAVDHETLLLGQRRHVVVMHKSFHRTSGRPQGARYMHHLHALLHCAPG